ncbi:MAG TPA: hypothetical protein VHQ39_01930 [Dongiaceae bacterium]|jgi:uncharacterized protein YjiS (DUF1127 family)|nr:hypothetical protein [Dongiaceae bacterium]
MKSQLLLSFALGLAGYVAASPAQASSRSGRTLSTLRHAGKRVLQFLISRRGQRVEGDFSHLSDHMLKDIGLDRPELYFGLSPRARR